MTLEALSSRTGVSVGSLSEIETGKRGCSADTLSAILVALDLPSKECTRIVNLTIEERSKDYRDVLAGLGAAS